MDVHPNTDPMGGGNAEPSDVLRRQPGEDGGAGCAAPAFLADQMLARLARWLRFLGYDCALIQAGGPTGEALARRARAQGRILLTCGRALAEAHPGDVLPIPHASIEEQVRRITKRWPLDFTKTAFTRCSVCNKPLETADFDSVAPRLPEKVRARRPAVMRCPVCDKLYWPGSHVDALQKAFAKTLGTTDW